MPLIRSLSRKVKPMKPIFVVSIHEVKQKTARWCQNTLNGKIKKKKKRHYTLVILSKYPFNKIMMQMKEKLQPTTGLS